MDLNAENRFHCFSRYSNWAVCWKVRCSISGGANTSVSRVRSWHGQGRLYPFYLYIAVSLLQQHELSYLWSWERIIRLKESIYKSNTLPVMSFLNLIHKLSSLKCGKLAATSPRSALGPNRSVKNVMLWTCVTCRLSSVRDRMHVVPPPLRPARLCFRSGLSPAGCVTHALRKYVLFF